MKITKYSASGNDFLIFKTDKKHDFSEVAKKLCDRTQGIGADGLIAIIPSKKYDFVWDFYNCDGSQAFMCGNGSRAAAMFAYQNKISKKRVKFLSKAGIIEAKILKISKNLGEICVKFTKPKIIKEKFEELNLSWQIIDTGVPHLVTFVDDLSSFDLEICKKMRQKYNANINFAKISQDKIFVRTFERGVEGETLACGTGMAACFYLSNFRKKTEVIPKSGEILKFEIKDESIYFSGFVKQIFTTNKIFI